MGSNSALALLEQPRFRAGLDFLRLRGEVGEADPTLAAWWEKVYEADDEHRRDMLEGVREPRAPRRVRKVVRDPAVPAEAQAQGDRPPAQPADGEAPVEESEETAGAALRKRRRRRRKPGTGGGGAAVEGESGGGNPSA